MTRVTVRPPSFSGSRPPITRAPAAQYRAHKRGARTTIARAGVALAFCLAGPAFAAPAAADANPSAASPSSTTPASASASASAAAWNIDQLMSALSKATAGRASFVEVKTMAMLERPVTSSGELLYAAPDRLEKRTVKPAPETMRIQGDTLTLERGKQKHELKLTEYPELAGFIDSIRGTLAGNRQALENSFVLALTGPAERWNLTLKPKDAKVGRAVHLVTIKGAGENVATIEIIQSDGDRSVMTITKMAAR
jgi:outer membrane lipoprotein-sorting protein